MELEVCYTITNQWTPYRNVEVVPKAVRRTIGTPFHVMHNVTKIEMFTFIPFILKGNPNN